MDSGDKPRRPGRANLILRTFAAAYLLFSVYTLLRYCLEHPISGTALILGVFAGGLFAAFALWLLYDTYKKYRALLAESQEEPPPPAPPLPAEGPLPAGEAAQALEQALSAIPDCVFRHRDICRHFNAGEYAASFAHYTNACRGVFDAADAGGRGPEDARAVAGALSRRLTEALWADYAGMTGARRRDRQMDADKRVLLFYLVPMVRELRLSISEDFALSLQAAWLARCPGAVFGIGDYQKLLRGFDHRLPFVFGGLRKK